MTLPKKGMEEFKEIQTKTADTTKATRMETW
jgi:hypothetical protein